MSANAKNRSVPDSAAETQILKLLAELGDQRTADEREGGALWAEVGDWCWAMDLPRNAESVDLFAADRDVPLSGTQLRRLRNLAERSQS
ncbi:hypothetical protein ACI799_01495 [Blastococcus sp. SYSU DS0753]